MQTKTIICLILFLGFQFHKGICQQTEVNISSDVTEKKKINFFVVSKRKKGKLDMATRYNVFRSKVRGFFCKRQFVSIVARDAKHASLKITKRLQANDARLGTIWFDSHGMYKKGYSLFYIGSDEISYKTLKDSTLIKYLSGLTSYADAESRLVIGSCYGGATYNRSSVDYKDTTRMNGDSLMIAIGNIVHCGKVYASESWVMTKPGLFRRRPSVGGFPGRKLFRDLCYEPAWKNMGIWNKYDAGIGTLSRSNPVALDRYGNLIIRGVPYKHEKTFRKSYHKKSSRLQTNLYK